MSSGSGEVGFHPPQQARSRAALRRVLESAEHVLATDGYDDFTMAAVAEHAEVSIGGIYRRFAGKEQLLVAVKDRMLGALAEDLEKTLRSSGADLAGTIHAFARVIAATFSSNRRAFPDLLRPSPNAELEESGRQALASTKRIFEEATRPFLADVRRPDPSAALAAVQQMITGACIHRATTVRDSADDGQEWDWYAAQLAEMAIAYLATSGSGS